jgi:hypothetical protein
MFVSSESSLGLDEVPDESRHGRIGHVDRSLAVCHQAVRVNPPMNDGQLLDPLNHGVIPPSISTPS